MPEMEQHQQLVTSHRMQELIRDVVIGMADGLTVPFALAAGLAGALPTTQLVVTAGLAEIAAGCIAMGLGAYLAVVSDHDYFHAQLLQLEERMQKHAEEERALLADSFRNSGIREELIASVVADITEKRDKWADFTMKYRIGLEHPSSNRARNSSLTIGLSYVTGGLIPLIPYMAIPDRHVALTVSVLVTLMALFLFGLAKAKFLGTQHLWKSALQTSVVGGLAASVAYVAARWIA